MPNDDLFYRHFELDRGALDKEKRTVPISFSSETPIPRWFGSEILLHGRDNVDLDHLKATGSVLFNHNPDRIIGPLSGVKIVKRRGQAMIGFDDDEDGNRAMAKVESGSLRGVSFGYKVLKFREVLRDEVWQGYEGPADIALKWMPYEITLTPIPADASVGIGRCRTRSLEGIEIERSTPTTEEKEMEKEEIVAIVQEAVRQAIPGAVTEAIPQMVEAVTPQILEAVRTDTENRNKPVLLVSAEEIRGLTDQASAISPEAKVKVLDLVAEGRGHQEITGELLRMATQGGGARDPSAVAARRTPTASGEAGAERPHSRACRTMTSSGRSRSPPRWPSSRRTDPQSVEVYD